MGETATSDQVNTRLRDAIYSSQMTRRDRWAFEGAARVALRMLRKTGYKMLNVTFDGAAIRVVFAVGERADDLDRAFQQVRAEAAASKEHAAADGGSSTNQAEPDGGASPK